MTLCALRVSKWLTIPALLLLAQLTVVCAYGQTPITTCGTSLSGGEYVLANDLNCTGDGIVIRFNTQPIVLNLQGHRITGSNTPNRSGIFVDSLASVRVVGPGVISNYTAGEGVFLGTGGLAISAVTCTGNKVGFYFSAGTNGKEVTALARNNVAENNVDGFYMAAAGELDSNLANGNSRDGIFTATTKRVTFWHNTATFNGRYGIGTEQGSSNKNITSNTALDNVGFDLFEGNSNCQDRWSQNTFGTKNLPCIQ